MHVPAPSVDGAVVGIRPIVGSADVDAGVAVRETMQRVTNIEVRLQTFRQRAALGPARDILKPRRDRNIIIAINATARIKNSELDL